MPELRMSLIGCGLAAAMTPTITAHADRIRDFDRQAARLERQTVEMVRFLRWEVGECPKLEVLLRQADGLFCLSQEVQRELLFFDGDPRSLERLERKLGLFQEQTLAMCATIDGLRYRRPAAFGVGLHAGVAATQPRPGQGWAVYFGKPYHGHSPGVRSVGFAAPRPLPHTGRLNALHHRVEQLGRSADRLQRDLCRI
ncbi:MAG: hypothetical protein AAGA92_08425 [Planctomycetota bacterium]